MLDSWRTAGRRWWQHMKEQAADKRMQALIVRRRTGQMARGERRTARGTGMGNASSKKVRKLADSERQAV
jgi:hypothetical protein